jgi:hypothetical protein
MMRNLRIQSPAAANLLCVPESNVASTLRIGGLRKTNFSYRNHALVELITKFGEHGHIGKYSILSIAKTYKHPKYKVREP